MLNKRLEELRVANGLSKKAIGQIVNVTPSTYASYESGSTTPTAWHLLKLADFYGTSVDYLIGREDRTRPHSTPKTIKSYEQFNGRRYGKPWVAIVNPRTGRPDFKRRVGGYTGSIRNHDGDEGDLYVADPSEGGVYMYGQKDYRGNNTQCAYVVYLGGKFHNVANTQLISALSGDYTNIITEDAKNA